MSRGFIVLPRSMFDTDELIGRSKWHPWMAWLDVVQLAAHRPYEHRTEHGLVKLDRGEVLLSLRLMSRRWGWSVKVVRRWLEAGPIRERLRAQRRAYDGTVYLVVNYDTYDLATRSEGTEKGTEKGNEKAQRRHKIKHSSINSISKYSPSESSPTVSEIPPKPSSPVSPPLTLLPKAQADAAYVRWGERFGAVNYGRLRKVLVECVEAGIPAEELPGAVEAYADWYEGLFERDQQFNRPAPEKFAVESRRWARLGKMELFDRTEPTERGMLLLKNIPSKAFA